MSTIERIQKLREQMKAEQIDMYVVPTADFHQSEYVGEYFKVRQYLTGFTGSAGTAVITQTEARLWTDARYFIQAARQIAENGVLLMKMGEPEVPTLEEYLRENLPEGGALGVDGRVISLGTGREYERIVAERKGRLVYEKDLMEAVWTDRPALSKEPVFQLAQQYAGETTASKLERIRQVMQECGATAQVLTTLDDICWTLNIRGNDVLYFPLVLAYAVITLEQVYLYIEESKLDEELKKALADDGVVLRPYNSIYEDMKRMDAGQRLMLDPKQVNYALCRDIPESVEKIERENPEIVFKARKNEVEIANIRQAQIKDSVAHVRFMKWLKERVGKETITEISASDKLDELREQMGHFLRPSFAPISSYGEHAAICHYSSTPETNVELKEGNVFLTDTGAGFYEGSTDITRTYALGEIPQEMKEHFTLVAISNLSLASGRFLQGCTGLTLDMLARKPFWDRDLDYKHGTGHGVGYLLNVHEGPSGFRWVLRENEIHPLEPGMVITDEPGIYIEGSHGVRLENELLICKGTKNEFGQFLYFEPITYIPFDLDAILPEMMSEAEKKLLNDYHKTVYEKVSPHLNDEEKEWLRHYTRAI